MISLQDGIVQAGVAAAAASCTLDPALSIAVADNAFALTHLDSLHWLFNVVNGQLCSRVQIKVQVV